MRIGLFGGSFDPAHRGHAHVARTAARRLCLHRVWWLVSPQNPLKPRSRPFETRLASAQLQAKSPRMLVTDLETRLGLRFTADTVGALRRRCPGVRFVFVMGEDNMEGFHRWRRWPAIFDQVPVVIVPRPKAGARARMGKAFQRFAAARTHPGALGTPPGWALLGARHDLSSSTALRSKAAV
jgi:nicotinate-nucleotide adenylyltransferase